MKIHALRLLPGNDLKIVLMDFVIKNHIQAGIVLSAVGSLQRTSIRFADQPLPVIANDKAEIISLSGTLSPDGVHLHISIADKSGKMTGGHLSDGNIVFTTAEIVLAELPSFSFSRKKDPATGYPELQIDTT